MTSRAARAAPPVVAPFVVTVAASAGGLNAITMLLAALPADLSAAVLVVLHLPSDHPSYLVEILARENASWRQNGGGKGRFYAAAPCTARRPTFTFLSRAAARSRSRARRARSTCGLPRMNYSRRQLSSTGLARSRWCSPGRAATGRRACWRSRRRGGGLSRSPKRAPSIPGCPKPPLARARWTLCYPWKKLPPP